MTDKQTVKFGDICKEVKLTTKDPIADGYERYIGLEHLDSGSLKIKRWGIIADDSPSFTRVFKKGQILFGKRRPYLKKAAIAEFDGICSGDIIVMDSRERLGAKGLLPFIIQNDKFWGWAIKTSSGSLSPRTKFKSLEVFKLELPAERQQFEVEKILEKSNAIADLTHDAIEAQRLLCLSVFNDLFKNESQNWTTNPLGELFEVQLGKMLSKKAKQGVNPKPYLANFNVQWNTLDLSEVKEMDFNEREMDKFQLKCGDILVCEGGEIGRSAIWNGELEECYYQKALHRLRPLMPDVVVPEFLVLYMEYKFKFSQDFKSQSMATTIAHIPREKLIKLPVSYPDVCQQKQIVTAIKNLRVAEQNLEQKLARLADIQQVIL